MSKRKPHSMAERWRRQAQYAVRGYAAAFVTGNKLVDCVDMKRCRVLKSPPMVLARAISDAPHHWTVLMSVMGRDWQGKPYYKHDMIVTAVRYRQASLVDWLNEQHQALIATFNPKDKVAAGWIAVPEKTEITDAVAEEIYTQLGAWN